MNVMMAITMMEMMEANIIVVAAMTLMALITRVIFTPFFEGVTGNIM